MRPNGKLVKKVSAIAAVLIILALFAGGQTTEPYTPPPTVLHDDFDPRIGQKEVYVENTGDPGAVLFVRVKFHEFLDVTTNARPAVIEERRDGKKT
jgi:hypothetical protein